MCKTLLFFSGPTCGKCKIVYSWLESFKKEYGGLIEVKEIDTSLSLEEAKLYNVTQLPAFVLLDETGHYLKKVVGSPSKGDISRMIDNFSYTV